MPLLPRKTSLTLLVLFALLAILHARNAMPAISPNIVVDFPPSPWIPQPHADAPAAARSSGATVTLPTARPSFAQLSDPANSLVAFYQALEQNEAGTGITRILHYGDSPVTADSITADIRSLLQERFGDAGHGFVLAAKPWAWYSHRGVTLSSLGWRIEAASQSDRARDGMHGLGGVAFEGGPGAWSQVDFDTPHSRLDVAYLLQPSGGMLSVFANKRLLGSINTASPRLQSAWTSFNLAPDILSIRLEVKSGAIRLFGVTAEKSSKGVIYNSLGLNGGQVQVVVRYFDPTQWGQQLKHQKPDLVVVNYGTNESLFPKYLETTYPDELRDLIRRVKTSVPEASVLLMSPMDRGERAGGQIATAPSLPKIVQIQRSIAEETGCAFFNTFEAMGGAGTMGRWYASQPPLVTADFIHPFPAGARKVGELFDDALISGYERFKTTKPTVVAIRQDASRPQVKPKGPGR